MRKQRARVCLPKWKGNYIDVWEIETWTENTWTWIVYAMNSFIFAAHTETCFVQIVVSMKNVKSFSSAMPTSLRPNVRIILIVLEFFWKWGKNLTSHISKGSTLSSLIYFFPYLNFTRGIPNSSYKTKQTQTFFFLRMKNLFRVRRESEKKVSKRRKTNTQHVEWVKLKSWVTSKKNGKTLRFPKNEMKLLKSLARQLLFFRLCTKKFSHIFTLSKAPMGFSQKASHCSVSLSEFSEFFHPSEDSKRGEHSSVHHQFNFVRSRV